MSDRQKPWVVLVPAYEPPAALLSLLACAHDHEFASVVVDDGSTAQSAETFQAAAQYATVLHHATNMGKGCALKTGLAYIQEHYEDCIVATLDADGQHTIADAERLCAVAQENADTLVLGCRDFNGNVPAKSKVGNTVTRHAFNLFTGMKVHDTQTGLRAFDAELIPALLAIEGQRYEYEMNVLLTCARERIPTIEVGIETIYIDGNASSHYKPVKDSFRIFKEFLKFSASSFTSFLVDYGLFSLLTILFASLGSAGLIMSNVCARVVSATVNYSMNRLLVFQSDASVRKTALQYATLAVLILAGNTAVLSLLVNVLGVNQYLAKICTELLFFLVSWLVQRFVIFAKQGLQK